MDVSFAHVPVLLSGGAPWGFTLKGGLEHGEPLVITKIEVGGKAALCQRLRVGDELIAINGTVLYGSRQEALILIKGSYRVLRLTVRRLSGPVLRPHSWHSDQVPKPVSPPPPPPPPPPSPPCLPPPDSAPLPLPPPPCAMQLHPGPCSLPWHNNQPSDLSIQWGALSCPYSSTDRSSSLGSMDSLDTPTPAAHTPYDSRSSPMDPALFNNKRDSAYSSFSASSNTSEYAAAPLRFGEGGSTEHLLGDLPPNANAGRGLDDGQVAALKSRSLTRPRPKPIVMKERPSSCCCADERRVGHFGILQNGDGGTEAKSGPPRPPTRKDSFRATKGRANVANNRCSSAPIERYFEDGAVSKPVQNGSPASDDDNKAGLEPSCVQNEASLTRSKGLNDQTTVYRPQNKHTANVLHRHSAPEKLLATQLQLLQFDDAPSIDAYVQEKSTDVWRQPENGQDSSHQTLSNKWSGSRCSTPGSVFLEDCDEGEEFQNGVSIHRETPTQISWGRSVSVPEEPVASSVRSNNRDGVNTRDFEPLSPALSADALVEKKMSAEEERATAKKSARNLRKNRRRNERFATNLRNEIQRKKAQLQSGRGGPGGLLCSGETVHEEGPDFHEDGEFDVPERRVEVAFAPSALEDDTKAIESSSAEFDKDVVRSDAARSAQIVDSGIASCGIRVIEEPAPAGKARRWRWTPEHKLQLENEPRPQRHDGEKRPRVVPSRHGVCSFMSSSSSATSTYPRSMSCSRMEESDLLPFADRMKFFEETSKTGAPSQTKPKDSEERAGDLGTYHSLRRYSYQGGYGREDPSLTEARRRSVSAKERAERLRQAREVEEEEEREREEGERTRQREREREAERRQELERIREMGGVKRENDDETERRQELERIREMGGVKRENDNETERRQELERIREMGGVKRENDETERERREYLGWDGQNCHRLGDGLSGSGPDACEFELSQVSRSAFYPVKGSSRHFSDQRRTPTEMFPARQQESTKLNRKFSLTERDCPSRRWESILAEQSGRTHRRGDHSDSNGVWASAPLRTRAMSENDLSFDAGRQRWSPSPSLSEVEERAEDGGARERPAAKKKTPPPPRPPPPKWEQFHKRRASHHAIYAPPPQSATGVVCSDSSFEVETSRQRSYSLPPQRQELSSATPCTKCSCHQNVPQDQPNAQNVPYQRQNLPQDHPNAQNVPYQRQNFPQDHPNAQNVQYQRQNLPQDHPNAQNVQYQRQNLPQDHPNAQNVQYQRQNLPQDHPNAQNVQYQRQNLPQDYPNAQNVQYQRQNLPQDHPNAQNLHQNQPQNSQYSHEDVLQDQPRLQKSKNNHQNVHQEQTLPPNLPYKRQNVHQEQPYPQNLQYNQHILRQNSQHNHQNPPQDQTLAQNFQHSHQNVQPKLHDFHQNSLYNHEDVLQDQPNPQNSRNIHQNVHQDKSKPPNFQCNLNILHGDPSLPPNSQYFQQNHPNSLQTQETPQYVRVFPNRCVPTNQTQAPHASANHKHPPDAAQTDQLPSLSGVGEIQPKPAFVLSDRELPPSRAPPPLRFPSNQIHEPLFSIAPPSPMFSRRAFRPVAPPQWSDRGSAAGEEADEFPPPPPPVADDLDDSFSDSDTNHSLNQEEITKKLPSVSRHTAEWERTTSPMIHSGAVSPPPPVCPNPETFFSIKPDFDTIEPKNLESERTLSPSASLDADLDVPLETDIDDFQEEELLLLPAAAGNAPISSELPCLALPVTVLETDLDMLPEREGACPGGAARPESSLLGDELEVRDEGSPDEMFRPSSEGESGTESWRAASQSTEHNTDSLDRRSGASSSCSSYYSTSAAKAQLLSQMKELTEQRERDNQDELMYKKQLMESLRKKLGVLREAQRGLQDDIRANAQLGEEVEAMVVSVCKPNEVDKFRMFIGDLDKVVSLLLSLSGRLLRVETTLDTLESEDDEEERRPLLEKKRQLMRQLSEAQDLKDHVDRREQAVSRVLGRCLGPEQHRDYSHFVKMKAALLVEQKQLEDKIRLGEEQLRGLRESLGLGLGPGLGLALGYGQF